MAKLTDEQFFICLREGCGKYAWAVKIAKEKYNVTITRQSVRDRALKHPELLQDIKEEMLDIAEEGLIQLAKSNNSREKLEACKTILLTVGKSRGYTKRVEIDAPKDNEPFRSEMTPISFDDDDDEGED